jgi:hypothetical protein
LSVLQIKLSLMCLQNYFVSFSLSLTSKLCYDFFRSCDWAECVFIISFFLCCRGLSNITEIIANEFMTTYVVEHANFFQLCWCRDFLSCATHVSLPKSCLINIRCRKYEFIFDANIFEKDFLKRIPIILCCCFLRKESCHKLSQQV